MSTTYRVGGKIHKGPTILQMEAVECGAAALAMILEYYGRIVPLSALRHQCGVSRDGSKASNVLKAARVYGFEAKGFKKQAHELGTMQMPAIVFWNNNHFLVVQGFGKDKVYLNDPAVGARTVTYDEFERSYSDVVLTLTKGPTFEKGGSKPGTLDALKRRLEGSGAAIRYCIVAGLLLVLPGLALPVFTQIFVDDVLVKGLQDWLRPLLLGLAIAAILRVSIRYLQLYYMRRFSTKLAVTMTGNFLWRTLCLPTQFFSQRSSGEISNRVRLNDQVADLVSRRLVLAFVDVISIILYACIMLTYDRVLTLVGVTSAVINFVVLRWVVDSGRNVNLRYTMELGKASGISIAGLLGIETLKASGLEGDFFSRWSGYYTRAMNTQQEIGRRTQVLAVLPPLLQALTTMALLTIGGFRVMDGHLTMGMLVGFQSLMGNFMLPVTNILNLGTELQTLGANLDRLDDLMLNETDPETSRAESEVETDQTSYRLEGHVELIDICFRYGPLDPPLLDNLTLKITPGQRVALVGGSGSGKSTVAKLLTGLYAPDSGEILLDGKPRTSIPRRVLNNSLAMVEQDLFMFAGSVRDNLTLWDATVSDAALIQACKDADVHEIVLALPGGYDGKLNEGAMNLSGGQRQRLAIATALVGSPSILVLDEATSALDSASEKKVDQALRRRGCTCVIVAHRLSTIRDCDEIIVLERGKVVQRGTHDELRAVEGHYKKLIDAEGALALQEA